MSELLDAIRTSGLLDSPALEDDSVTGRAHLAAAVADVSVTVDAEEEDVYAADLVAGVARILDITEPQWSALVDEIATELEDAVGDEPVAEPTDLRDDLAITSIVVLPDATLLVFAAPRQFPDSWVRVQLDESLEVEDLVVDAKDED
jgi:hypothetical protein